MLGEDTADLPGGKIGGTATFREKAADLNGGKFDGGKFDGGKFDGKFDGGKVGGKADPTLEKLGVDT